QEHVGFFYKITESAQNCLTMRVSSDKVTFSELTSSEVDNGRCFPCRRFLAMNCGNSDPGMKTVRCPGTFTEE
ncbi:MAG: hypothetical protein WD065_13975, partial [Planctomycetaceae bacterium]